MNHRSGWTRLALAALALALIAVPALAQDKPAAKPAPRTVSTATEWAPGFFDRAAAAEHQRFVATWLRSEAVRGGVANDLELQVAPERLADVAKASTVDGRLRVGLVEPVDAAVAVGAGGKAVVRGQIGAAARTQDGWVWTARVASPGASALRLHLTDVRLPAGVEMYVYGRGDEAFGPYTGLGPLGNGAFWTHTVAGGELFVQLRAYADKATGGATSFRISEVGHMGPDFKVALFGPQADKSFCSFNEPCIQNASCSSVPSAIQPARDAVAHMLFRSGGFYYICSGGLLADTNASTQVPLFLTAHHCISKGSEAASLENYFQFSTPCNGSCYDPTGVTPRTVGASILATGSSGDFTLMQLAEPAPAGSAFLGWTNADVANVNNTNLFRISHPAGAPQAYSTQRVDTSAGTCRTLPRGQIIYSRDTFGGTEGGSSGSPVMNSAGQVVGQLYGACGTNVNDACDSASNATVDGALAYYYPNVSAFLDPGGSCTDSDGDGSCASEDCDDFDPNVHPGAAEVCDGIDNDCDGSVDEGCGSCLNSGASCTSNGQCCSGNCKGKPGSKTCK